MDLLNNKVAINFTEAKEYPKKPPFDPPENYPEYRGVTRNPDNKVYAGVRETLYRLGLDQENFGTSTWNPFKEIIKPGDTVFIKPNTVRHHHVKKKDVFSVIVHGSILRPLLDYVCIALENEGRIIVGDSQTIHSRFDKVMVVTQIENLIEWYRTQTPVPIKCFDLRICRGVRTWLYGKWGRKPVEQDPRGYRFVDLGKWSCFNGIDPRRLRIAIASHKNMYKHHSDGKHEYLFPQSFLDSDVVINIPKLKTHRRTAVTLALKNFMGIPAWKDTLPHFITGSVTEGGDQYIHPSLRKRTCTRLHDTIQSNPFVPIKFICAITKKMIWNTHRLFPFKDEIYEAMWHGNDTLWRTLLDLNRAVFYADKEGRLRETQQRKHFCLIDGIIAGEKDGPIAPEPVPAGVLLAGYNPAAIDAVAATLMGFDVNKIPLIKRALEDNNTPNPIFVGHRDDIQLIDNGVVCKLRQLYNHRNLRFEAHPNWKGYVEIEK